MMSDPQALQAAAAAANKKRKRSTDADHGEESPKRPSINGDNLEQTYGEDFAQHLQSHIQSATHAMNEHVNNGLPTETQQMPYGNGEAQANGFEVPEPAHQPTPHNGYGPYKHIEPYGDLDPAPRPKPAVGSAEWHQNRKDCHKEVERRRRETINEGIMSLAGIIPDCEKAKGAILQRAVTYVHELRNTIEQISHDAASTKANLESILASLTAATGELRTDNEAKTRRIAQLEKKLADAGIALDD